MIGYAEAYRNGERIPTAHLQCTVNQLINWRMCKKQQGMEPSRSTELASPENSDYQRATGTVHRDAQYRPTSAPDPQVLAGLELIENDI